MVRFLYYFNRLVVGRFRFILLVAKAREATVEAATRGRLDTAIMRMWRHSVSKHENLDPLVELLILVYE